MELSVQKDFIKVTYYLSRKEYEYIKAIADYLYNQKAIARPTLGTYSRAAAIKMYQEINDLLAKEKEDLDKPIRG
jgi:hypothetical protein